MQTDDFGGIKIARIIYSLPATFIFIARASMVLYSLGSFTFFEVNESVIYTRIPQPHFLRFLRNNRYPSKSQVEGEYRRYE